MTGRHFGAAMALLAGLAATTAPALAQPSDADLREAREFERLVRENRPAPSLPPARAVAPDAFIDVGRGPIPVHVPAGYDGSTPTPLVILLHGYTNTGQEVEDWMQFASLVDEHGFLYVYPTGTSDFLGNPFWNATDACCNLFGSGVDDSTYLRDVIEEMRTLYNVDDRSIHFAGHSNGGFMSYRMACDHADVVASIASLAGATYLDPADCTPVAPVHALQIHGTSDAVIGYGGGCIPLGGCHPGAVQTTETWAAYDGCSPVGTPQPGTLDIDADIPGAETQVVRYADGCVPGGSAEIWTIPGGPHSPNLSADYNDLVIEFLLGHPKPAPCPADFDGGGVVDVQDLLALLAAWGSCPGCPEDIDGNGAVDVTDLLALLAAWGACA
jgi:polyhydroxybutyrate depolymerase